MSPRTPAGRAALSRRSLRQLAAVAVVAGLLAAPSGAQGAGASAPAVELMLDSSALRFEPADEAEAWLLTVSGPAAYYLRQEFRGRPPRLELAGAAGPLLGDGDYAWELRAVASIASGELPRVVASGTFAVSAGLAALPREVVERAGSETKGPELEPLVPTHSGDVYIDGHLCVGSAFMGTNCSGSESLALRTILLREDNVRVRFEDTSDPSGMFPSTDWQLLANDSSSGGADYFAVQDLGDTGSATTSPLRIDAGAGDDAIRVDASGEVGLGTATPGARLHVNGAAIVEGDLTAGSSREIKRDFSPIEPDSILARLVGLPVQEWSYRADRPGVRHLGPVAEDLYDAFGLGRDPRHVSPLDLSGIAFAAIQGLHELVRERDARIEELARSRDEMAERLSQLEAALDSADREVARPKAAARSTGESGPPGRVR